MSVYLLCRYFINMSRLSLVAEFDDLVRSRAVLAAGIETGLHVCS